MHCNHNILGEPHEFGFDSDWGFDRFISIDELYETEATLLRNNSLQLCVRMKIYGEHHTTSSVLPPISTNVNTLQALSAHFLEMFNDKKHSDVEIVCDTETFHCHKLILSGAFIF